VLLLPLFLLVDPDVQDAVLDEPMDADQDAVPAVGAAH
jgi:hypothetical protein